jgi:spore coat polysaccharide biosynthesis predicted glycosyltransferase SpsG
MGCDFHGIVENVQYADDCTKVTVKGHVYAIDDDYNVQHLIKKGDYLIKRQGSTIYRLVKYQRPRVFTFDNQTAAMP